MDALDPLRYGTGIEDARDSHEAMLALIEDNTRVLEVGCASGAMTKMLADRGCSVVGIEIEPAAAEQAREFAERVVVADVEALDFATEFGDERFDTVVFGDVLEHLRAPLAALRAARSALADGGSAVISIPNVAHGDLRLSLLKGEFRYRPWGLLDAGHLRFFTRDTLEELVRDAGFVPVVMHRLERALFSTELELAPADFDPGLVAQIDTQPESHTYQFVLKVVPCEPGSETQEQLGVGLSDSERSALELERASLRSTREELYEARDTAIGAELSLGEALGHNAELKRELRRLEAACPAYANAADANARLAEILRSRTWRMFEPYRRIMRRLRGTG